MQTLMPSQAAAMAEGVYRLRSRTISELRRLGQPLGCEGMFHVSDDARIKGRSGAVSTVLSGFGYLADGEGAFEGEMVCVTRGTQTRYDWASNFNVGVQTGPGNHFVHAGFNEIFKSYRETLDAFVKHRNPAHIHCVGHSLGGALAFLNADYFTTRRVAPVSVYSFGAPRAGLSFFANDLTTKVGADRIFRASHMADPVPMIPLFPFNHAPTTAPGYVVGRETGGAFISIAAHGMLTGYIPATTGISWDVLRETPTEVTDREIKSWLEFTSQGNNVLAYSAEALRMIGRLLWWILRKTGKLIAGTVGVGLTVGFTLLDRMAWMLARGAEISKELATAGMAMARAIFRFLGYVAEKAYDLTAQFLRRLLGLLVQRLGGLAQRAMAAL